MRRRRPAILAASIVLVVAALAGLLAGAFQGPKQRQKLRSDPVPLIGGAAPSTPAPAQPGTPGEPPRSVPQVGSRAADPADVRVIRRWADAVRRGDLPSADHTFHLPAKVQNGAPVVTLESPLE